MLTEKIGVIGLGYVGLPLAAALSGPFHVVGVDTNRLRIEELLSGLDRTGELDRDQLEASNISFSSDPSSLRGLSILIVTVPTPVDAAANPDLSALRAASATVGENLSKGSIVVFESTVYPGATEEVCLPIIEKVSGLRLGVDFSLGYSPERINPGDREHTLATVTKVVAASDQEALHRISKVYESVCAAGVHQAPSIRVAEAAKVIENTQRDLNIALINELAMIFDRLDLRTKDVLAAARTKWNFLPFSPGLVGGHCIGVDPYYLTHKAQTVGYNPEVILAGRRVNDGMGKFLAQKTVKLLATQGKGHGSRIGVLGLTFKENVPDLRNSKVPDVIAELVEFGMQVLVTDAMASPQEAMHEYGLELLPREILRDLDAVVVAVPHLHYEDLGLIVKQVKPGGVFVDVKSCFNPLEVEAAGLTYWSL
jgi:UDP-N-acetyl-D-glucosamine/UDP-N-acetyl-D-galactosamine dehydrogenase